MDIQVNIFKNTWDKDCTNVVSLVSVLSAIKNGRWKEQVLAIRQETDKSNIKQLKEKLPAVTFCGIFDERIDEGCVHYNNIMIVDIDKVDSRRLKTLREELKNNIYVLAFFSSPSNGLKILIPIDSDIKKHNTSAFYYIEELFGDVYDICIDRSGKNVSRLCYVSYDEDLYYNPDAKVLHIEETLDKSSFIPIIDVKENFIPSFNVNHIFENAVKMVKKSKTGSYRKGNRNNFIFVLSCLMCEFGIPDGYALDLIYNKYSSLDIKEVRSTVRSAYRRSKGKFGTRQAFQKIDSNQQSLI